MIWSFLFQAFSTPLYQACFTGDFTKVKEILEGGADVNEVNDVSMTDK